MNRWDIPVWLEQDVLERDRRCVYCRVAFLPDAPTRERRSWEHIVNDANLVTLENIALCCRGCNASKGAKDLGVWLESEYCKRRDITCFTVAPIVQAALAKSASSTAMVPVLRCS